MWEVATRLAARGDEVAMLCSSFPGAAKREERDGIEVHRLGGLFTTSSRAFFRYLRSWRRWSDVVVEEALGGLRIPYAASAYVGVPVVAFWYQTHRLIFEHQFGPLAAWTLSSMERRLAALHRRAFLLTCSTSSKEALLAMGFSPDRIEIYYPGPSAGLLAAAERMSNVPRAPTVVMLGKIRRYKSFHHGVYVLERLKRWVPDARLVIAGRREDVGYEDRIKSIARRLQVDDSVSFALDISEDGKAELLRRAKVHLICSPTEGFGLTAIEAYLLGTPVVSSDGISPEAVRHGLTGYRVPFGEVDMYAEAVRSLLVDDGTFHQFSRACTSYAREFSWDQAAIPIFRTIDSAAGRGHQ